jgi:tetratricopeptide (TPR) repeat protein
MDEVDAAIDLGPENDQQLARLRRALILGSGFQLVFLEISHPSLRTEVLRRLREWSGIDGVPALKVVMTRPGRDPIAALQGVAAGAILVGIDQFIEVHGAGHELAVSDHSRSESEAADSASKDPVEQTITTLNWYRDQLPSLVTGPLVLVLTPDGLRQLFVHAPDLLAWRSHTTRITTPGPIDLEVRPQLSRRASLEEKAWLERMIASSAANLERPLARVLPGWLIRLGEIDAREGGNVWKHMFARAEELAAGRRGILFRLELARERRALDEERYEEAEIHEGRAAEQVSDSLDTNQEWESARGTPGWGTGRREPGWVSHDAVFAELRIVRAERLLCIGEGEQAATVAESALRSARASGDLALVIGALGVMASVAAQRGDLLEATTRFSEMRDVARFARDHAAELFAMTRLAELGPELVGTRQMFLDALSLMQDDDHEARARAAIGLARHDLIMSRNLDEAERILSELEPLSELQPKTRIRVHVARGSVATARDDHGAALGAYRMAWDEQQRVVPPSRQHARISVLLGEAALRGGDVEVARGAYQRAAEIALVLADRQLVATARRGLARIETGETGRAASDDVNLRHASGDTLAWTSTTYLPIAASPTTNTKENHVVDVMSDDELAALESEFVALDAPGDAPERLDLLDRLARVYARLGRRRDAGLCFSRAVWEAGPGDAQARLDAWIAADLGGVEVDAGLARALELSTPTQDDVRLVAALAVRAGPEVENELARVQRWLDDHDGELDTRTLWLARVGLAGLVGGDARGLAHARDRILSRLAGGLTVERELPAFLRLAERKGAVGNATGEQLSIALEELSQRIARTRRRRLPVEAPAQYTGAYVNLQLGYGFARIGKHERARELVAEARNGLARVATDPVHAYLVAAFTARVDQAIAGVPPETPLPGALRAQFGALDSVSRYKVDRLREASRILEPIERPDAIGAFSQRQNDSRGPEFAALRGLTDPRVRARAVDALVVTAVASEPHRERLLDGIFDVLLELPESEAVPILVRAWPLVAQLPEARRAVLYAAALVVAGHFGRAELVPELLALLGAAIRVVVGPDLERVLQHSLRALRRIGLRNEIAALLADAEHALPVSGPAVLHGRLALAAGLAFLGNATRALLIFQQARSALNEDFSALSDARRDGPRPGLTRPLELTRALALAYAQAPLGTALAGIAELAGHLREITDGFGTNSHYCLSVLHFVESLVLGITSDDLVLGEAGRRFVEDDEHLIRRRLHRDLRGSSR